ncbi:transcription elongation factor B polypeptide 3 [Contarinia nasturtii]|uniref:transcription elongation factor B polypeptide 3 n=1 Tax=Contarinia nasturtii TaxID=265458 RepID=UPI0012D39F59|nr:transcription elongation factor B polypeptide 3 [Contarinia nasturtii]XP_031620243.1 transcription elongation factor B polypeptide 3 [Contarinia nasturtii]
MTNASTKMTIEDMIRHYQRSIDKSQHDPKRILHCIGKLNRMQVTVKHLQLTKIGKTVNSLRKDDGEVGEAAKALVAKWKDMVNNSGSGEENAPDEYNEDDQNYDDNNDDDDDTRNTEIHSVSRSERKSHKTHEHTTKNGSSSSSSNNIHHNNNNSHHNHQYAHHGHRSPEKMNETHSHQRKYSSDDTQEHSAHSKHKQKSHSHNDNSGNSSKREHEAESNGSGSGEHVRHKMSSKHHSKDDRHHRSRHEIQHNGDEYSDKKHKSSSKDKHSEHHKSHSSKHKRSRESDHTSSSSKKRKSDSTSSSSQNDEKKTTKTTFKHVDDGIEIDHSMGTSFADALGMLAPPPSLSGKASTSLSSSSTSGKSLSKIVSPKSSTSSFSSQSNQSSQSKIKTNEKPKASISSSSRSKTSSTPSLLLQKPKLPPLEIDLAKDLPPPSEFFISNDYKPTPLNPMILDCLYKGTKSQPITMLSETDSLCASTTSKNQRTKVYSGVKTGVLLTVPSLHELCIRFLQKNVDALEYTGGVPFEILKPVLERATPEQLALFEHYNPYLVNDSDILWQQHCQRKFKAYKRQEMETWREMYDRCQSEQEARLNRLTKNIIQSQSVAIPVRQTKLAYVDSMVKPPRNIIKKQNQFGTHRKPIATPAARVDALSSVASNITRPGDIRLKTTTSMRDTAQAQPSNMAFKPKKAPLMAKTLQLLKGRMRR